MSNICLFFAYLIGGSSFLGILFGIKNLIIRLRSSTSGFTSSMKRTSAQAPPTPVNRTSDWSPSASTVKTTPMCPIRSWTVDGRRLKTNTRAPLWEWNTLVSSGGRRDFIPLKNAILGGIAVVAGGWFLRSSLRMCMFLIGHSDTECPLLAPDQTEPHWCARKRAENLKAGGWSHYCCCWGLFELAEESRRAPIAWTPRSGFVSNEDQRHIVRNGFHRQPPFTATAEHEQLSRGGMTSPRDSNRSGWRVGTRWVMLAVARRLGVRSFVRACV